MIHTNDIDWTHKDIFITDVRKLSKLYVIKIIVRSDTDNPSPKQIDSPLFVKDTIFEERLTSYYFKNMSQIYRNDILNVTWNMYLTQGFYIKINEKGDVEKFPHDPEKWYVSYLEIEGPLGTFSSIYRDKELNNKQ